MDSQQQKPKGKQNRGYYKGRKQQPPPQTDKAEEAEKPQSTNESKQKPQKQAPQQAANVVTAPPPPPQDTKLPAPRHLATKQTPYKNDPMYMDSLVVDGDRGFVQSPQPKTFSPSFDSFMPLIHADYNNIVSSNRPFGKVVPLSVYAYYNVMHLWARIFAVLRHRKQLTVEETRFLERFEHDSFPVTEPINGYLRCVGDFTDTNGVKHLLKLHALPNKTGHFGRISAENHNVYEAYPAPLIALTRVQMDMDFTERNIEDAIWEIRSIRPADAAARQPRERPAQPSTSQQSPLDGSSTTVAVLDGTQPVQQSDESEEEEPHRDMPTANLLGWWPAQKLSSNQMMPLNQITAGGGFQHETHMMFVYGLVNHVADNLNVLRNYKKGSALHESASGSVAQEAFLDPQESGTFHRCRYYCDQIARVSCLSSLDVRLAAGMRVMGLRVKKNDHSGKHTWACYDFDSYSNVPGTWIANRNNIFAKGLEIQAYGEQHTVIADRQNYVKHYLRQAIVKTSRD